jgi:NagD protein
MLQAIIERHGLQSQQVAMVGDRLYTDMRMARDAGALAVLTLTGEARESDVDQAPAHERPDIVVADLDELSKLL